MKFYVQKYRVTETCQNGKERQITKEILIPMERDGHPLIIFNRGERAEALLREHHYYDIEFLYETTKDILIVE